MSEPRLQVLDVGAIRMRVAELGQGPDGWDKASLDGKRQVYQY
jgi:hypothetical protein